MPRLLLERAAFTLTACAYAAANSPVFLGGNFGRIFDGVRADPLSAPLPFYAWAVAAGAGVYCLHKGLRTLNRYPGDAWAVLGWGAALAGAVVALGGGWILPAREWGVWLSLASRGVWFAVIAACVVGLWLTARGSLPEFELRAWRRKEQQQNVGQENELREARAIVAELTEYTEKLETMIGTKPVRDAVFKAWHPDGTQNAEVKQLRTAMFQFAGTLFDRLGVH